jgi:hypothetical protein
MTPTWKKSRHREAPALRRLYPRPGSGGVENEVARVSRFRTGRRREAAAGCGNVGISGEFLFAVGAYCSRYSGYVGGYGRRVGCEVGHLHGFGELVHYKRRYMAVLVRKLSKDLVLERVSVSVVFGLHRVVPGADQETSAVLSSCDDLCELVTLLHAVLPRIKGIVAGAGLAVHTSEFAMKTWRYYSWDYARFNVQCLLCVPVERSIRAHK